MILLRVIRKILEVSIVFVKSPYHHLNDSNDEENETARVATLDAEDDPGEDLPPVVGAGDPLEAPCVRETALLGPGLPQVAQVQVAHEVEELKEHEEEGRCVDELLRSRPGRGAVLRVQEEIHVEKAEEHPVVEAVLQ